MKHDQEPADALEALDPAEEAALAGALVCAVRPEPLSRERHDALLESALLDPEAEPTDAERAAAEALRRALDEPAAHPDAELARALAGAVRGASELAAKRATERAMTRALPNRRGFALAAGVSAALALAAGVALVVSPQPDVEHGRGPELAESRSLSPLFAHEAGSGPSERLDRIVALRSRELRDNRFSRWGVR